MEEFSPRAWQVYFLLVLAPILLFIATTVMIFILFGFPPGQIDQEVLVRNLRYPIMATEWLLVLMVFALVGFRTSVVGQLGLRASRWWMEVLLGIVLFFILWGVVNYVIFPVLRWLNLPRGPGSSFHIDFQHVGIGMSFLNSATAGLCEEFIWRGYALNGLIKIHHSPAIALVVSSIFFGLFHWGMGPAGIVSTGIIGFLLGLIVLWRKNLWAVIIIHFLVDFF